MSECFLVTPTTEIQVLANEQIGQTFIPVINHLMHNIDLQLRLGTFPDWYVIEVYDLSYFPMPFGIPVSTTFRVIPFTYSLAAPHRYRFCMSASPLYKGNPYAIVIRHKDPGLIHQLNVSYIQFGSYYPRGNMIYSPNNGYSWFENPDSDLIFSEFGTPPLPKSYPTPPIQNWALMDMTITHWDIGLTIRLPTNVPCHLTCYYTYLAPRKGWSSRTIRGLTVPWTTDFTFVEMDKVEQTEAGDTLYHTFEIPTWMEGFTKWFTFRGEVDITIVPSVGPIFKHKHPGGLPRTIILRPNAPGDKTEIPYQVPVWYEHWDKVDEEIPDEDATVVTMYGSPGSRAAEDLYHIQAPPTLGKVASVEVFHRTRAQYPYLRPTRAYGIMKTHNNQYDSPLHTDFLFYQTYSTIYPTNPFTDEPWTEAEVQNLQIGVHLESTYVWYTRCTQVYAAIHRGIEGGPD